MGLSAQGWPLVSCVEDSGSEFHRVFSKTVAPTVLSFFSLFPLVAG